MSGTDPEKAGDLLGECLYRDRREAWLVNTGWSGGLYRTGSRIGLRLTRRMVRAALAEHFAREVAKMGISPRAAAQCPVRR